MKITCIDCGCNPYECIQSKSSTECPQCLLVKCCCWSVVHEVSVLSIFIIEYRNTLQWISREVIKKRKMIRKYQQDRQIPTEIINKFLRNAHRSPSAGHTQVQEFIIVIDPITKGKLCEASLKQSQVEDAPVLIVVCSNTSRSANRYRKRGTEFYGNLQHTITVLERIARSPQFKAYFTG